MRIAIPICEGRISPVFDVARRLMVVDTEEYGELSRMEHALENAEITALARRVAELGVDVLICGAISRALEQRIEGEGVRVIRDNRGHVDEVLQAFVEPRATRLLEYRYRHRDGSYRWLRWNAELGPKRRRIYAVARDVTEHKRLEGQVLEITDRVVLCLNLVDEAGRRGLDVDARRLARDLGVPVVPEVK